MKDFVECNNCNFKGLINTGDRICPSCNSKYMLSWVDENFQEVEDDFDIQKIIKLGSGTHGVCCEELNKEGYNIEWGDIELMNTEKDPYFEIAKRRIEESVNKIH